jgi:hypothetical protein
MIKKRRIILGMLTLYILTLFWGYARLPWAAIKSLNDYPCIIVPGRPVNLDACVNLSSVQEWYIRQSTTESTVPVVPRLSVEVKWNALVVARVRSGYRISNTGAEWRDTIYFCLFGFWIPIYDMSHAMA